MTNRIWIKAEDGPDNSVVYYDKEGNKLIRHWKSHKGQPVNQASTRSWRNNNPGNLALGPFARKNGAIGGAGKIPNKEKRDIKFAVFPDYAAGRKAQAIRLKEGTMYIDLTLNQFVRTYTGVKEGVPDTEEVVNYRKAIKFFTKFDMKRTIRSLNAQEYEQLLDAMKKHEGWREGREEFIEVKKVVAVRFGKNHSIAEFLIGDSSESIWISKKEAVALAKAGLLLATVVHAKHQTYLRPKYHQVPFRQLPKDLSSKTRNTHQTRDVLANLC